jgi:hypothetical protein
MRKSLIIAALALASSAWAKPWMGIAPGKSTREDVIVKFGDPLKELEDGGDKVLGFGGAKAIKGTEQVQIRIGSVSNVVERIDVFPQAIIDREAIEGTYGQRCGAGGVAPACYEVKVTDDFKPYFFFGQLGVAVFFDQDPPKVSSFVFSRPVAPTPVEKTVVADAPATKTKTKTTKKSSSKKRTTRKKTAKR